FTRVVRRAPYPTISASRPELSQAGKTVLVTGGATGIGHAIAINFVRAGASTVIIVGRRGDVLEAGAISLRAEAEHSVTSAKVATLVCDQSDRAAVRALWSGLQQDGVFVDTLVLNAADFTEEKPILDLGADRLWTAYETNVRGPLDMVEGLSKQPGDRPKAIVNVATQAINMFYDVQLFPASLVPGYGLTKNAGTLLMQQIAKDVSPEKLQVVSFHPGMIYSDALKQRGVQETDLPFEDVDLPGCFAVWAASTEARFLHGRFVWASWNIDEYSEGALRKRIDENVDFLRIGVVGL
ncbi:putative short-chain dehydrogenase, partial [Thozetella sp. PMI_491]